MKRNVLIGSFGIALAAALVLGGLVVSTSAQQVSDEMLFTPSSATISLTDSGISISPSELKPGPVTFTVENNSSVARGVYVTGLDRAGTPIIRYSMRIGPGASTHMNFWLYQGETYTFRDYTSRRVIGGKSEFASTYSTNVMIPTLVPIGRGPEYERLTGRITITGSGIEVSPSSSGPGPIEFTVVNDTSSPRGVVISGEDRANTPIFRYSHLVRPGGSRKMSFWLYEGQTYTIRDYTRLGVVAGAPRYGTRFSTTLAVR